MSGGLAAAATARVPLQLFFPLGAVLVYGKNDVRPALDPECCHGACKCCLRVESARGWGAFVQKASLLVKETPPDPKTPAKTPTLRVVCEQHAQVQLLTMARDRFGNTTVRDMFTLQ